MHANSFDDLIPHMKRAGFVATGLAALITSSFGWTLGENLLAKVSLAGLLALCTFIVGYALVAAYHAFQRGMYAVAGAAVTLFVVGVIVEFLSHTGFTASHRDATMHQASFQQTSVADLRGTIASLEKDEKRIQDRLRMAPARNADQAQAAIDNAKAHRFWSMTKECTETKGPQTRAFCDAYRAAEADKAGSSDVLLHREELKATQEKLAKARAEFAKAPVAHASAASQGVILASMATFDEKPSDSAVFWAGVGISSLLALFAICAGGLLNFIAFAFDTVARPVKSAMANATPETRIVERHTVETDGRFDRLISNLNANGLLKAS